MDLLLMILLAGVFGQVSFASDSAKEADAVSSPPEPRALFKPRFIDFTSYQQIFHKHYASLRETVMRRLLYLARAMQAFLSGVRYKSRQSSYYLKVNDMSDWTQEEMLKLSMKPKARPVSKPLMVGDEPFNKTDLESKKDHLKHGSRRKKRDSSDEYDYEAEAEEVAADEVYVDHRTWDCYQPVRNQGSECGSCYAFVGVFFYEWLHCTLTGVQAPFSEQYIVDCGSFFENYGGCDGGIPRYVAMFVSKFGMEYAPNYPYTGIVGKCKQDAPTYSYLRTESEQRIHSIDEFPELLKTLPILVGVAHDVEFLQYGGGVDNGYGERPLDHGMLIIGHGRENGDEYWLFRNSHGQLWGEGGHYKLNKDASHLIDNQIGYTFTAGWKKPSRRRGSHAGSSSGK